MFGNLAEKIAPGGTKFYPARGRDVAIAAGGSAARAADPWLLVVTFILLALSVLMVFSTTAVTSAEMYGDSTAFLKKHILHITIGLFVLGLCSRIKPGFLRKATPYLMIVSLLVLLVLLVSSIGHSAGGARRWMVMGPLRLQPAELIKVVLVLYFASYIGRQQDRLPQFVAGVVVPLTVLSLFAILLLLQPDFGTTAVIVIVALCQLLVGGTRFVHLFTLGVVGCISGAALIVHSPYRFRRLQSFLDPFSDPSNSGYQLIQSLIAVGSGGLMGAGLGAGKQKLFYLPAAHTDFIFAVIAEELGLIGALFVVLLFLVLAHRGFRLAQRLAADPYLSSLAIGLTLLLVVPAFLNIGVVTGLLPTKGMVLPLLGYGGTAMIASLGTIGLLISLSKVEAE